MYCGACARDMVMARGLSKLGHDFQILPLYTPLKTEGEMPQPPGPIFMGGINAWLQQHSGLFRRLPNRLDRLLDHPALLRWAARFAVSTRPEDLGPLTVSVLAGREGRQRKELQRLLDYLQTGEPPQLISLTNSLLSGLAPALKDHFGVPLVCGLQGEEEFVAGLPERYHRQALQLLQANAAAVDLYLAPSAAYAGRMAEYLGVSRERVAVVQPGVEYQQYERVAPRPTEPFTIGYLSVIIPRKGLDLLVDAFLKLAATHGPGLRLKVAGQSLNDRYLREVQAKLAAAGRAELCEFLGEVDLAGKVAFLHGCSAFCVPSRFPESRGMAILEAMAAGVPVVAPDHGIYPELFGAVEGGRLHAAGDSASLAHHLEQIITDPAAADEDARQAQAGLREHYSPEQMALRLQGLFAQLAR
jgi:glycosyltransferase involved in cell wall biosynthesis